MFVVVIQQYFQFLLLELQGVATPAVQFFFDSLQNKLGL